MQYTMYYSRQWNKQEMNKQARHGYILVTSGGLQMINTNKLQVCT